MDRDETHDAEAVAGSESRGGGAAGSVITVIKRVTLFTLTLAVMFVPAGRLGWWRGWILLGTMAAVGVMNLPILRWKNPVLLRERFKKRKDTKPFDKVFFALYIPASLSVLAVAGFDAGRSTSEPLGVWALWMGVALVIIADVPMLAALVTNPHLETTARIQTDRGHRVVTTGPYRFVRHPMYVGALMMFAAWPLILGSVWAYVPVGVLVVLFVFRTALEDRMLCRELDGYREFAEQTRYRLIRGIW